MLKLIYTKNKGIGTRLASLCVMYLVGVTFKDNE